MAQFCLTKETIQRFKEALKSGEINPMKLAEMSSEERRTFLEKYVGKENSVHTNALFESKLLLKNQKAGYISWAKKIGGITPEVRRDILAKIERLDTALNPTNEKTFLHDLVESRLGLDIKSEEAKAVSDLSNKLVELKKSFDPKKLEWSSKEDAKMYGAIQRSLENYISELKTGKRTIRNVIGNRTEQFKNELSNNPIRAIGKLILDSAMEIARTSTSLVATFDDSLFGRQGGLTLLEGHPGVWLRNFGKSFSDIVRALGGKKTTDALLAEKYSDPLYMNGEYKKAGILDVNVEQYPTSLPGRIFGIGRVFRAAEEAFINGTIRMKTELYKLQRDQVTSHGIEIDDAQIKGMGDLTNSTMAQGNIGRHGANPIVRLLMWAPKMLKADLDILTAHSFSDMPKNLRVQARWNLAKIIATTTVIEGLVYLNNKKDTEFDPRSSSFLQIGGKIGFLRGIPAMITLMARILSNQYKDNKGNIVDFAPGVGKRSRLDAVYSFLRGKAPPATGAVYDKLAGQDFQGNPPTFTSMLLQHGVPISIQNLIKLRKDPTIDNTFGVIADFFGLNSNINPEPNIKSQVIPEGKKVSNTDIIEFAKTYAEAISSDPETAFNRMFTGQKIVRVANGTVIVQRMSLAQSTAVKKAGRGNNPQMKLDHTIPLEIGGSNDTSNLKLVTTSQWSSYTKVENVLGKALKSGNISKSQAQSLITKFKSISDNKQRKAYGGNIISKYK